LFPFIENLERIPNCRCHLICEHEKSGFRLEKCLGGFRSCRPTTTSKVDDDDHERARERERESYAKVWYASFSAVGADTDTGTSIAKTNKKGHRIVKQVTHGSDFSYGETSREVKKERDGSQCRTHTLAMWAVFIYWAPVRDATFGGTVRPLGL
jgi:hypothetical protein